MRQSRPGYYSDNRTNGFTVAELLVVIVVIGILASVTIVGYSNWKRSAITAKLKNDINNAVVAIENARNFGENSYSSAITLPFQSSDDVTLIAGSFDGGDTYCVEATSDTIATISYHIILTERLVKEGRCPVETFVVGWGGTLFESAANIIKTSDGGYAITGETESFGNGSSGSGDMYIAKYSHDGELVWDRTWGAANFVDYGSSIIQTTDGGYAVAGYTSSYGAGEGDMFIAKYSSSGDLLWSKTWGSDDTEHTYSIIQSTDGGYVVTGSTQIYSSTTSDDAYIVKFDSNGDVEWDRTWGSGPYDCGIDVLEVESGGYLVVGNTRRYNTTQSNDMFVAKYTSDGDLSWSTTWGGTDAEYGYSVIQAEDGFVVTGLTESFGAGSNADMFLAKLNSSGFVEDVRTWSGSSIEWGTSISAVVGGGYVITGRTKSYGSGNYDMFITKFDSSLNHSWSKTFGGDDDDRGWSVVGTLDGGMIVTGYITDIYGAGSSEAFIAKYNSAGEIVGCPLSVCRTVLPTISSPSATMNSPTDNNIDPDATVYSYTPAQIATSNPTATETEIVPLVKQ